LERKLASLGKRSETLWKRSEIVLRRLGVAERELQVWRYMAWLERARPRSERLISVITPTRNRAEMLERCIDSVLAQAHTEFELLVVDDGSDDATPEFLARCSDPRVRSFRIDHAGVCAARNHGLDQARGSVIAYLDDDNLMDPLWLMAVANAFDRHPEISVLYGARLSDDRLAVSGRSEGSLRRERERQREADSPRRDGRRDWGLPGLHFWRFDRSALETRSFVDTNTIAHRRDHPEGRFDEELSSGNEDWDLIFRLTRESAPYELPAIACEYSTRAVDRLSDRHMDVRREEVARVLAKHGAVADDE
jgi:glycosyltransferase involved in cell wall biosynthesis